MSFTIAMAGGGLEKVAPISLTEQRQQQLLTADNALFLPINRDFATLCDGNQHARLLSAAERKDVVANACYLLGLQQGAPVFALYVDNDQPLAQGQWLDLRRISKRHQAPMLSWLAAARGLVYWHQHTQFCGVCGAACEVIALGHHRRCRQCQKEWFPRIDPAVIMLVESVNPEGEPCILLGAGVNFVSGVMSILAGFVDIGESLEEAVIREVWEETQVKVDAVQYICSQPWPFPCSMMIGFFAQAQYQQPQVDAHELHHARWVTADELCAAGEWGDDGEGLKLPRLDSISRLLINYWLAKQPQ